LDSQNVVTRAVHGLRDTFVFVAVVHFLA